MLAQPSLLRDIVDKLSKAPAVDDRTMEYFFSSERVVKATINESIVASMLSEMWLRERLSDICGVNPRIDLDPIRNKVITSNYVFMKIYDNIVVFRRKKGKPYSDFDCVILIDNIPVLFEIKLARYKGTGYKKPHYNVAPNMEMDRINHVLDPLKEYFRTDQCAYVLVISKDQIKPTSPIQQEFLRRGGFLVPFYTTRSEFKHLEVPWLIDTYQIPVSAQGRFNSV